MLSLPKKAEGRMKEKLVRLTWGVGIRAFRLSRRVNLSTRLEPAFMRLARLVPSTQGEVQTTLPFGMTLRMPPGYRDARTVTVGLFQLDEAKLFQRLTRPGMTVVDVGAYIGYFTLLSSHLVGPTGQVFAFEPEADAYRYLLHNVEANNCRNVVAVRKAVSDTASTATLVRDPVGPESFLTSGPQPGQGVVVDAINLDNFFEAQNWPPVHLIKMNIEGWELPALKGMRELSKRNPELHLIIEFNPMAMTRGRISSEELGRTLTELGFRRGQIVERGLKVIPAGKLVPTGDAVYNIYLTK
jgi:FkbM family methyltransferase